MLRNRILALYKTLTLRTQRNRVMPVADSTPAASFTWANAGVNDAAYMYPQIQLTGVNKQITLRMTATNPVMLATMFVQGTNIGFTDANAASYPATLGTATFTVTPGQYCLLYVESFDEFATQVTTITITNVSTGATIATFTVTLIPPV